MRRKLLLYALIFFLFASFASAYTTDNAILSCSFDSNSTPLVCDGNASLTAINGGATRVLLNGTNYAYDFELSEDDNITLGSETSVLNDLWSSQTNSISVSFWIDLETSVTNMALVSSGRFGNDGVGMYIKTDNTLAIGVVGSSESAGVDTVNDNGLHHIVYVWDKLNNEVDIYIDGVADSGGTLSFSGNSADGIPVWLGRMSRGDGDAFDGKIDQIMIFNYELNQSKVTELYNGGVVLNPYASAPAPENFTFRFNGTGFGVDWLNGTTLSNSTGSLIVTGIARNDTQSLVNFTVFKAGYFNRTVIGWNTTSDYNFSLNQSIISFSATELFTGAVLSNVSFSVNGSSPASVFYLDAGSYYVTASKSGYYSKNFSFVVSPLDNLTVTVDNLSDSLVSFNLTDVLTGVTVGVDSYANVTHLLSGESLLLSGTEGNFSVYLLQGNYTMVLWADGYAFRTENVTLNSTLQNVSFGLYSNNSVWVYAYDVDTSAQLFSFSVELYDNSSSFNASESGGYASFSDVPSGYYTVVVSRSGYVASNYFLTMTGGSHQRLNAYLSSDNSTSLTIFTAVNSISGVSIEGVTINQYRTLGGNWTLIASKDTDLTGRAQFSYTNGVEYRFDFVKSGYESRSVNLEPLFSSYSVPLTPEIEEEADVYTGDWVYWLNNSGLFYNDLVNNFLLTISSGLGTIEYYNLSVVNFNGSLYAVNCSNSYGCAHSLSLNISGASFNETVVISFFIKETGRALKYFKRVYFIQGTYEGGTLSDWKNTNLDSLEKAIIATIAMLLLVGVVAGVSALLGVPVLVPSGVVLSVSAFVFAGVHFIPLYAALLVGVGALLILVFGRGES